MPRYRRSYQYSIPKHTRSKQASGLIRPPSGLGLSSMTASSTAVAAAGATAEAKEVKEAVLAAPALMPQTVAVLTAAVMKEEHRSGPTSRWVCCHGPASATRRQGKRRCMWRSTQLCTWKVWLNQELPSRYKNPTRNPKILTQAQKSRCHPTPSTRSKRAAVAVSGRFFPGHARTIYRIPSGP